MFCKNCGSPLPDGAIFCGNCGTSVAIAPAAEAPAPEKPAEAVEAPVAAPEKAVEAPVVEQAQPEAPAVPESNTIICKNCGNQLPNGATFCGNCGASVAIAPAAAAPASEKPAEAVEAPVAAPEKTVESVEAPVAAPEKPAEAVGTPIQAIPAENAVMPETAAAPAPKKKVKKAPIIVAAAAVVVVAGAAVGYFCFHDKITRLFMGDAGYAKMIEASSYTDYMLPELGTDKDSTDKKTADYVNNALSVAHSSLQSYSEQIYDENSASSEESDGLSSQDAMLIEGVQQFKQAIYNMTGGKDAGFSTEYHVNISVGPQIKMLIGTAADSVLNSISDLGFRYTVVAGDTSKIGLDLIDKQGDIGGVELYMNGSNLCIAAPEITESVIAFELPQGEAKENKAPTLGEEDIKRIISGIGNIYFSYYDKAEITYTDNAETAAGQKGTAVSVKLSGAVIKEMLLEITDFIKTDSYIKEYCISAGIPEEKYKEDFEKSAAEIKEQEIEGSVEIINYVDVHNKVIGKRIISCNDKEKAKSEIVISSTENKTLIDFIWEQEDKDNGILSIINEKTGEASGTLYFKMPIKDTNGEEKLLSIAADYESKGETSFLGNNVPLGKITLRFADDDTFIDSLASKDTSKNSEGQQDQTSAKLMESDGIGSSFAEMLVSAQLKKSRFEISIENGENGLVGRESLSIGDLASLDVEMFFREIHEQVVMPSLDKAIDIENADKKTSTLLQLDVMKWVKKLSERNDFWGELLPTADIAESIENTEKSLKFYGHYSEYDDYYTAYLADRDAEKINEAFNNGIGNDAGSGTIYFEDVPTDVELYFDSEGNVEVIDSGSWYGDFPAVFSDCELKSAYVRIGITSFDSYAIVVYTDKSNDLPAKLPDKFNFIDGVFEWDDDNVIGEFVVGTYPSLDNGVSTAADKFAAMDKAVAQQEKNAEAIGKTAQNAESMSGPAIIESAGGNSEISLEIAVDESGNWSVVSAWESRWEEYAEKLFNQQYLDMLISLLGSSYTTKDIKDCSAEIIFVNGELVGVNAYNTEDGLNFGDYGLPSGSDYTTGYYYMWAGKEGLWNEPQHGYYLSANGIPVALGTYCISTGKPLGTYDEYLGTVGESDFGIVEGSWTISAVGNMDTGNIVEIGPNDGVNITLSISANNVVLANGEEIYSGVPVMAEEGSVFSCVFTDENGITETLILSYAADEDKIYCYSELEDESGYFIFSRAQYFDSTGE